MTVFTTNFLQKFLEFAEKTLVKSGVPGSVVAVIEGDQTLCVQAFGQNVSPNTLFPIASLTKSYTAASIALLVEDGIVRWEDPVLKHIPHFCFYNSDITKIMEIHDLLTHRTGLYPGCLEQMATWGYGRQALQLGIQHVVPKTPFRSTYAYNNVPYLWVEDLFLELTGHSWAHFIEHRMLEPLGLKETYVGKKAMVRDSLVQGYILDEETRTQLTPISFSDYAEVFLTAGGLVSSAQDVANWVKVLMGTVPFLTEKTRALMQAVHTPIDDSFSYGLGLRQRHGFPVPIFSHGGLIQGIRHQMVFVPEKKVGVVVLTNLTHSSASSCVVDYFCRMATGLEEKSTHPSAPPSIKLTPAYGGKSALVNGVYTNPILGSITVRDHFLILDETGAKAHLTPISSDAFSVYFLGSAGAALGEGHFGTLTQRGRKLILRSYESFSFETFVLNS